jgi:rhamnogalacturonyl hydrolase YesR
VSTLLDASTACLLLVGAQGVIAAQPYSEWLASSAIARGQGNGLSNGVPIDSYEHGAFQRGLTHLYEKTGNKTYLNYIQTGLDNVITSNGTVQAYKASDYSLDNIRIGESIVQL